MKRYRPIRCNVNGLWYQKGMQGHEDGEWIKYEDHVKMVMIVSHEPKDLLEDIKEGNEIIEKQHKEIEAKDKEAFNMSAELTYLRGVINCALGNNYPSDIGCELHELNKGMNK